MKTMGNEMETSRGLIRREENSVDGDEKRIRNTWRRR